MREILFRGKTKVYNKWVYGWYCGKILNHDMHSTEESSQIIDDKTLYWHTCEPETCGQFTGLTDKNGKKIFEGDIVRNGNYTMIVVLYDFHAAFMLAFRVDGDYFEAISNSHICLEVIGNIHDNPELLESP